MRVLLSAVDTVTVAVCSYQPWIQSLWLSIVPLNVLINGGLSVRVQLSAVDTVTVAVCSYQPWIQSLWLSIVPLNMLINDGHYDKLSGHLVFQIIQV